MLNSCDSCAIVLRPRTINLYVAQTDFYVKTDTRISRFTTLNRVGYRSVPFPLAHVHVHMRCTFNTKSGL